MESELCGAVGLRLRQCVKREDADDDTISRTSIFGYTVGKIQNLTPDRTPSRQNERMLLSLCLSVPIALYLLPLPAKRCSLIRALRRLTQV